MSYDGFSKLPKPFRDLLGVQGNLSFSPKLDSSRNFRETQSGVRDARYSGRKPFSAASLKVADTSTPDVPTKLSI